MYYIEKQKEEFIKYEIQLNKEKLEQLRYEIILNCGEIIPQCYEATSCKDNPFDYMHIHDYKENFIRWQHYNDFYSSDEKLYEYSYLEYKDTELSLLIDLLLKENVSAIGEIKKGKFERRNPSMKIPYEDVSKLLSVSIDEISTWKIENVRNELKRYKYYKELNKSRKSEYEYQLLVLSCIQMTEVGRISIDKVVESQNLMEQASNLINKANSIREELKPFFSETNHEEILEISLK